MAIRWACAVLGMLVLLAPADGAVAVEKCKVKVDKKTGDILFSGSKIEGSITWSDRIAGSDWIFENHATCIAKGKAKNCSIGDVPPAACEFFVQEKLGASCLVRVPGCTPGLRSGSDLDIGSVTSGMIGDGTITGVDVADDSLDHDHLVDEPGAANAFTTGTWILSSTTRTLVRGVAVTAPDDGWVLLNGTATVAGISGASLHRVECGLEKSGSVPELKTFVDVENGRNASLAVSRMLPVDAGTTHFAMTCIATIPGTQTAVAHVNLNALWVSTLR